MSAVRAIAAVVAAGGVAGLGLTVLGALDPVQPAAAVLAECPEGTIPGPGNANEIWTDNNVAIYAGQDFLVREDAAEAEGLVIVAGDADFAKSAGGTFNVGWVGVGSGVVPSPGDVMLAVGGDLSVGVGTVLDVGANAFDASGTLLGGDVDVGGVTTPDYATDGSRYRLNNGTLQQQLGSAAIAPWATWGAEISAQSADFTGRPTTGTVGMVGIFLTFSGDGTSTQQVFDVDATVLGTAGGNPAIDFTGVPDGASVIVNVLGGGDVVWAPNYFADEGVRADDFASPLFGIVSARTLWNFPDASSLHLAGTSQVLGSILVPAAGADPATPTVRVTAHTNGRLYTNGTILMDGVGNEHHSYPWIEQPFDCIVDPLPEPEFGSVTIAKAISAEDAALLPPGTFFAGVIICGLPQASGTLVTEWQVAPGESVVVDGLPVGASCLIVEAIGDAARAVAPPPEGVPPTPRALHLPWQPPAWTPSPPTFVVTAADDPVQFTFTVTNAVSWGAFVIAKDVAGEGAPAVTFTGDWSCVLGAEPVASGVWSLTAGQQTAPIPAPVGAVCTVTESPVADPATGEWLDPVIVGSPVTITAGSDLEPLLVTVTNTFQPDGAFAVAKVVGGEGAPAVTFTGLYVCERPAGTVVASGTWTLADGGTTGPIPAPVGAVCTVTENPVADPATGEWLDPVITGSPVTITAGSDVEPVLVTVENTFAPAPETGGFEIRKIVVDREGIGYSDAFRGTWSCAVDGLPHASGTWRASTTQSYVVDDIPVGASCTVAESTPVDPSGGAWQPATISPATFTVTDAATAVVVTVTNVLEPGLPVTGGGAPSALAWGAGVLLLVAGAGLLVVARRHRVV